MIVSRQASAIKPESGTASSGPSAPDAPALTMLTFKVDDQRCGLPVSSVVRIIEMVTITTLPGAPDSIKGIINLHGKTVPVMDLRQRFGMIEQPYGLHTPIILVDINEDHVLGLVVDVVETVLDAPAKDLEMVEVIVPTELSTQMAVQAAYLAGVAKVDRQMILILNVTALLQPAEQSLLYEALENQE